MNTTIEDVKQYFDQFGKVSGGSTRFGMKPASPYGLAGAETNQQLRKAVVPHPTSSAGSDSQHILGEKLHFESSDLTGSEGVTGEEGEKKRLDEDRKK